MSQRLTVDMLLQAYRMGYFPMGHPSGELAWYSPDPRCVFELDKLHVSRSLRQTIRRGTFEVRFNTAFADVMRACADRPEGTWITRPIFTLYAELHRRGAAHSVESWREGRLAGGLYGVTLGGAFFGESMFSRATDASKVALVALAQRLRERGFTLLDTQWSTPHLERLGAIDIPRTEYLRRLEAALRLARALD
jgi:leucyl/phenylalanyl-tRNA--protein transferase